MIFDKETYQYRRQHLIEKVGEGIVLLPGNTDSPRNFKANTHPFVQDSSFLYYAGIKDPDLALLINCESGESVLYGNDRTIFDTIWMGKQPPLQEKSKCVGIEKVRSFDKLQGDIKNKKIHYLPPYRAETTHLLSDLLQKPLNNIAQNASVDLIREVVAQREVKSEQEIKEMEAAVDMTQKLHLLVMRNARHGQYERNLTGKIKGLAIESGCRLAYPPILTINGQILHNFDYSNKLCEGRLLLGDFGAESTSGYAADITRTIPVSGQFDTKQKQIYQIALDAQEEGINMLREGVLFKDIHHASSLVIANGLKDIGLMKGDVKEAVGLGVHALFFPHGLGHMIGIDVHDMESLGENYVGYDDQITRSGQFGLKSLRLAKCLKAGFVVTIEPGIYFIPELIEYWKSKEKKMHAFLNFNEIIKYVDFGGIRIEDECLVTEEGSKVLGAEIPKRIEDIEKIMAK